MLKVLLVDDEPFILQGLKAIVDWEKEGFTISAMLSNGSEAYEFLKKNQVDLIVTDIKMPQMTGLELLEKIRDEKISDAFCIVLTGFKDFSYIQTAMRYDCMDYLLKPVEKAELTDILRRVFKATDERRELIEAQKPMEQAYLARNLMALLFGKFDEKNVNYVKNHLQLSDEISYIDVEMADFTKEDEEFNEGDLRGAQRKMFEAVKDFLKEDEKHCIFDVSRDEKSYDLGLIYCDYLAAKKNKSKADFLADLRENIRAVTGLNATVFVGKSVAKIDAISKSYASACALKSLEAFRSKKNIYYYEEEISAEPGQIMILKDNIDGIIRAIEQDDKDMIAQSVNDFYSGLNDTAKEETVRLNVNYFLFRLIHIATELDADINQEEILRFIAEHSFDEGLLRGSSEHMVKFAKEYSDYLVQLRKNVSGGVLLEVEKEIRENFAENLTLRDLGKKYFVNSSYLGQIFQKKHGKSFKDYLTGYRINQAERMLANTDKRITEIAELVGYKDSDYFLKKFIEQNGCTPSKYRKEHIGN